MKNLSGLASLRENSRVWCGRTLAICYGLIAVAAVVPHGSKAETVQMVSIGLDKIIHFIGFAVMVLLAIGAASGSSTVRRSVFVLLVVLFGVGIEAVQYYLPYRTFNPVDIFANVCGVGFGVIVALGVRSRGYGR